MMDESEYEKPPANLDEELADTSVVNLKWEWHVLGGVILAVALLVVFLAIGN